jgi:hypothetical protein
MSDNRLNLHCCSMFHIDTARFVNHIGSFTTPKYNLLDNFGHVVLPIILSGKIQNLRHHLQTPGTRFSLTWASNTSKKYFSTRTGFGAVCPKPHKAVSGYNLSQLCNSARSASVPLPSLYKTRFVRLFVPIRMGPAAADSPQWIKIKICIFTIQSFSLNEHIPRSIWSQWRKWFVNQLEYRGMLGLTTTKCPLSEQPWNPYCFNTAAGIVINFAQCVSHRNSTADIIDLTTKANTFVPWEVLEPIVLNHSALST